MAKLPNGAKNIPSKQNAPVRKGASPVVVDVVERMFLWTFFVFVTFATSNSTANDGKTQGFCLKNTTNVMS